MIHSGARTETDSVETLRRLLAEQHIYTFAPFLVTGEGDFLPNGVEESSGYVLDDSGRIFQFWLSWDAERDAPTFAVWREAKLKSHWREHPEYRHAREAVGLH